jgi:hypothetical protein
MPWTDQQKLDARLLLPWTVAVEQGVTLAAYLEFGDEIPLPAGRRLPWEERESPAPARGVVGQVAKGKLAGEGWHPANLSTATSSSVRVAIPA